MTAGLVVVADDATAGLVCAGSGFPVVGDGDERHGDAPAVSFSPEVLADVNWLRGTSEGGREGRTIATAGERLWRRAPWPAADALFEWSPSGANVAVVGDGEAAAVVERLREGGVEVDSVPRLATRELEAAAVVIFAGAAGDPLPAEVPAVLAAGRILVTTPRSPDFGLRAGIDHCVGPGAGDLADLALSAARHPRAFESMRAYGRLAAERHRASRVLADLAADLELGL